MTTPPKKAEIPPNLTVSPTKGAIFICYQKLKEGTEKRAIVLYFKPEDLVNDGWETHPPTLWGYVKNPKDPSQYNDLTVEGQLFECFLGPVNSNEKVFHIRWIISSAAKDLSEFTNDIGCYAGTECGWAVQSLAPDTIKRVNEGTRFKSNAGEVMNRTVLRKVYRGDFSSWQLAQSLYQMKLMYCISDNPWPQTTSKANIIVPLTSQINLLFDKLNLRADSQPQVSEEIKFESPIMPATDETAKAVAEVLGIGGTSATDGMSATALFYDWGVGVSIPPPRKPEVKPDDQTDGKTDAVKDPAKDPTKDAAKDAAKEEITSQATIKS